MSDYEYLDSDEAGDGYEYGEEFYPMDFEEDIQHEINSNSLRRETRKVPHNLGLSRLGSLLERLRALLALSGGVL